VISAILTSTQRQAASLRIALIGKDVKTATIADDVVLSLKTGSVIEEVRAFGRETSAQNKNEFAWVLESFSHCRLAKKKTWFCKSIDSS
jgi:hypothetical protein